VVEKVRKRKRKRKKRGYHLGDLKTIKSRARGKGMAEH
jgi:hypothetical protein